MRSFSVRATILISTVLLAGCQVAVAGRRCNPAAGAARDSTHVLFCVNGRWKRTVTIGQAAEIIVGNLPGSVTASPASLSVRAGEGRLVSITAKKRNGQPIANAGITVKSPTTGPGVQPTTTTSTTDAEGVALFPLLVPNGVLGSSELTVEIEGSNVATRIPLTITAGAPHLLTAVEGFSQPVPSGTQLTSPIGVKVVDLYGNPVPGVDVFFQAFSPTSFVSAQVRTGGDGIARAIPTNPSWAPGNYLIAASLTSGSKLINATVTLT